MRASLFVLIAIFSNFFGSYIVSAYVKFLNLQESTAFKKTGYENGAIFDSSIVFVVLVISYCFITLFNKRKKAVPKYYYKIDEFYYFVSAILCVFALISFLNINWSFTVANRGAGQFNRSIIDSLSRLIILSLPITLFYINAYWKKFLSKIIVIFLVVSVSLSDISNGDRRMLFSFVVMLIFLMLRNGNTGNLLKFLISKKGMYLLFILGMLVLSYAIRASGTAKMEHMTYGLLNGTIGGLGVGKILAQVKFYAAERTGFLFGATFFNYFMGLLVPSFMFYLVGGDEFYLRASYLFDDLFNTNKNMGYDFMMIADFYWNFSYYGYFLYVCLTIFILNYIVKNENSANDFKFGISVLLAAFFIAGQRSDFGFFLKSFVYCAITLWLMYRFAPKYIKRNLRER
ncbi:O-antigen polymerase [Cognaticolwellia mytili]|uniref:O-antigen polymerase n=1 Tax=Cognaticolwellia mytili TaxID=1888913 RepID=UPI000A175C66|nr:O-antigen polymerase [Cognaticolwellia mytili]